MQASGPRPELPNPQPWPDLGPADPADPAPQELDSAGLDPSSFDPTTLDPAELDPSSLDPSSLDPDTLDPDELDPPATDPPLVDPPVVDPAEAEARPLAFQWGLLAWAGLVGGLTGFAVVGFHELLGFINNVLFGPGVELLLHLIGDSQPQPPPLVEVVALPADNGTPLKALLQIGLGGLGFVPAPN